MNLKLMIMVLFILVVLFNACDTNDPPVTEPINLSKPLIKFMESSMVKGRDTTFPFGTLVKYCFTVKAQDEKQLKYVQIFRFTDMIFNLTYQDPKPIEDTIFFVDSLSFTKRYSRQIIIEDALNSLNQSRSIFDIEVINPFTQKENINIISNIQKVGIAKDSTEVDINLVWVGVNRLDSLRLTYASLLDSTFFVTPVNNVLEINDFIFRSEGASESDKFTVMAIDSMGFRASSAYLL